MRKHSCLALLFAALLSFGVRLPAQTADYDLLIKNGKVFDGSGKPAVPADVAVKGGLIVKVGKPIRGTAIRTIDAKGLYATPGFIDLHTHADSGMYFTENRACLNYLYQGVTTIVAGQCGSSAWNIFEQAEDQMKRWSAEGIGPNAAMLVGHGTVREIVLGRENRAPTAKELEQMKALVKQAMEQGACGMSTGLIYEPGSFAQTDEVIELAKVVAPYGGIYHSHIRNENNRLLEALREAIEIGDQAGVPVHISHFKVTGQENWGRIKDAVTLIKEARALGKRITADQYPYRFANLSPYLRLIPAGIWRGKNDPPRLDQSDVARLFQSLGRADLIDLHSKVTPYTPLSERHLQFLGQMPHDRLIEAVARELVSAESFQGVANERERALFIHRMRDPSEAEAIRSAVKAGIERTGAENLVVAICVDRQFEGKSLKEVAALKGKSLEDTAIELDLMDAKIIPYRMSDPDIEFAMQQDFVGTGSDGDAPFYGIGLPHTRSYSTFLHKIKKYAQERKAVTVEHVIRSQTSLPAEIMRWKDRGWIKEGYRADIAVLDLDHLEIRTSTTNPHRYCRGLRYLLINGDLAIDQEKYTGRLPGQVLKLERQVTDR